MSSLSGPGVAHFAITPSDTVNFPAKARAIYVGVSGDIALVDLGGVAVIYTNVPQGRELPMESLRVNATGTTATNLVGMV